MSRILGHLDEVGAGYLTLNRPERFNALSESLLTRLQAELDGIAADETLRVVVLGASGRAFCAGHDLKQMRARPEQSYYQSLFNRCARVMQTINNLPQPVLARVQGSATAAGCQLVAACDLALSVPMQSGLNSINVGNAAAVFLYEVNRQRGRV